MNYIVNLLEKNKKYITGRIIDYGAGSCKYKNIIGGDYTSFDRHGDVDIIGDVLDSKLDSESFDTVICLEVAEHINNPFKLAQEIRRILKRGGVLYIFRTFYLSLSSRTRR